MNDDVKKKLEGLISGLDKDKVKSFLEKGGAQRLNKALSDEDKKKMSERVMKMDSEEIKKKLSEIDFKNLDINRILENMK